MRADKYGRVTVEGKHRYSTDPANAGCEVIVGFRALEVEVLDAKGRRIAVHERAYGQAPASSDNPPRRLEALCNKPNAWPNSQVREALPDPLREWLDRQDRATLRESLHTLKHADRESGWANAAPAMPQTLETTGTPDRASVELAAARLASGTKGVDHDEPVDPGEYDRAFATDGEAA